MTSSERTLDLIKQRLQLGARALRRVTPHRITDEVASNASIESGRGLVDLGELAVNKRRETMQLGYVRPCQRARNATRERSGAILLSLGRSPRSLGLVIRPGSTLRDIDTRRPARHDERIPHAS